MNKSFLIGLLLVIAFPSHALDLNGHLGNGSTSVARRVIRCPSVEFDSFFDAFSERIEIQMEFTKFPLKKQLLDLNAEPEPRPVFRLIGRKQIRLPLIPNAADRKIRSLNLAVEKLTEREAKVLLTKSDTDYQVVYFFRKNSCWRLERIEDWSL